MVAGDVTKPSGVTAAAAPSSDPVSCVIREEVGTSPRSEEALCLLP